MPFGVISKEMAYFVMLALLLGSPWVYMHYIFEELISKPFYILPS